MDEWSYQAADEAGTALLGAALEAALSAGSVVALYGTLGAGKTRLVQAIAEAAGIDRRSVVSPTFVLIQEHPGRRPLYHIDAYRISDEDEFDALGPEESFEGQGLTLLEWADRVQGSLPPQRVEVHIEVTGPQSRRFTVRAVGDRYADVIPQLRTRLRETPKRPADEGAQVRSSSD